MTEERKREILAGLFLFVGILILFFGIAWLKGFLKTTSTYRVKVKFNDVGGLREGDPVDIAGVVKGKVSGIRLCKNYVLVYLDIDRDVFLPMDSKIFLKTRSLFSGEKYVKIVLGKKKRLMSPDSFFVGEYLDDYSLSGVQRAILQLENILERLRVERLDTALKDAILDIKNETITAIKKFSQTGEDLRQVIKRVDTLSLEINRLMKIGEKGTMGRIIKEDSVYQSIMDVLKEIKELIIEIRKNPEKYTKPTIKIFSK